MTRSAKPLSTLIRTTNEYKNAMSFIAKGSSADFERHLPKPGLVNAVIADVIDIGLQTEEWAGEVKEKFKVTFIWEIEQDHPELDGPFRIYKTFTNSLHEKASMGKALEDIRGKKFTDKERKEGVDLSNLVGVPCQLLLAVKEGNNGNEYVNIQAYMPPGDSKIAISKHYAPSLKENHWVSAYAQKNASASAPAPAVDQYQAAVAAATDDDLPF